MMINQILSVANTVMAGFYDNAIAWMTEYWYIMVCVGIAIIGIIVLLHFVFKKRYLVVYKSMNSSKKYWMGMKRKFVLRENVFKRKGFIFVGWSTYADGSGDYYSDRQKVSRLGKKRREVVTLNAIWRPVKCNIKFNCITHKFTSYVNYIIISEV